MSLRIDLGKLFYIYNSGVHFLTSKLVFSTDIDYFCTDFNKI